MLVNTLSSDAGNCTWCCQECEDYNQQDNMCVFYRQKWATVSTSVDDDQSTVPRNRTHADVSYLCVTN